MQPNYSLLYVDRPENSARLYSDILGRQPIQSSPTFVLFALDGGQMLGLWGRDGVKPALAAGEGGVNSELAFKVGSDADVDAAHAAWRGHGLAIIQAPERVDFGYTFTATDPDGHRLRVFARTE